MRLFHGSMVSLLVTALTACDLAPRYDPPHYDLPDAYQGAAVFRAADSADDSLPRGSWWTLFGDAQLDDLEQRLERSNPTLQAAAEAYAQARDLAAEVQSRLYPQLEAQVLTSDNRESAHHLFGNGTGPRTEASNTIGAAASWEPDFWHAIRNSAHAQNRLAQASAADLATVRLSLGAELANDYAVLRGLDAELTVLRASIVAYQKEVEVARLRAAGNIASELDLARALSELRSAQALETETQLQRDLMQHAVAVLIGDIPSRFAIPAADVFELRTSPLPPGMPSQLLQRRPDIASAERRMAAANAAIGVARAAFYPNVTLSGAAGLEDNAFRLASLPNRLWSIGAGAMLPLFEGGLRRAALHRSWSQYAQTRDDYRNTVLAAFQDVEDALSQTRRLALEVMQQHEASEEARKALSISTTLYEDGLDNYLSVAVAQVQALSAETAETQLLARQVQGSVALVRALGGGWTSQTLPPEDPTRRAK